VECGLHRRSHRFIDTGGYEPIVTNCEFRTAVDGDERFEKPLEVCLFEFHIELWRAGRRVDSQERIQKTDQPGNTNFRCPVSCSLVTCSAVGETSGGRVVENSRLIIH